MKGKGKMKKDVIWRIYNEEIMNDKTLIAE